MEKEWCEEVEGRISDKGSILIYVFYCNWKTAGNINIQFSYFIASEFLLNPWNLIILASIVFVSNSR